jgi:hypothetical protein
MAQEMGDHPGGTGQDAGDLPSDYRQVGDGSKEDSFSPTPGPGGLGKTDEGGKLNGLYQQKARPVGLRLL